MLIEKIVLASFLSLLAYSNATAEEIVVGGSAGSIVLNNNGIERSYKNIIGIKDGFSRRLISIDDRPALQVSSRDDFYYTLMTIKGEIVIDCAYFDARNNYSGARVTGGMCGLNIKLSDEYDEIAQNYSSEWKSSVFSFDTRSVFESGVGGDFFLGRIGDVEVFDRYPSASSLENSSPQKIIKTHFGCFNFGKTVGFLVLVNKDKTMFNYLDVLRSESPMRLQRMEEKDLKNIAIDRCDLRKK